MWHKHLGQSCAVTLLVLAHEGKAALEGFCSTFPWGWQCLSRKSPHLFPGYRNSVRPRSLLKRRVWSQTVTRSNGGGGNAWTAFWTICDVPTVDLCCYRSCQALSYQDTHQHCWQPWPGCQIPSFSGYQSITLSSCPFGVSSPLSHSVFFLPRDIRPVLSIFLLMPTLLPDMSKLPLTPIPRAAGHQLGVFSFYFSIGQTSTHTLTHTNSSSDLLLACTNLTITVLHERNCRSLRFGLLLFIFSKFHSATPRCFTPYVRWGGRGEWTFLYSMLLMRNNNKHPKALILPFRRLGGVRSPRFHRLMQPPTTQTIRRWLMRARPGQRCAQMLLS